MRRPTSRACFFPLRMGFWSLLIVFAAAGQTMASTGLSRAALSQSLGPNGFLENPIEVEPGMWYLGPGSGEPLKQSLNINAADTVNADQLWPGGGLGLNLSGAGVTVGIWDGGAVLATHQEFSTGSGSRVTVVDAVGAIDHATHVAGTIGATGVNAAAHGMANQVLIRSRDFNNDLAEMAADMGAGLISLSNHSYGYIRGWEFFDPLGVGHTEDVWYADRSRYTTDPNFGKYDADSRSIDQMLNQNQGVLAVWSAGNDRGQHYLNLGGGNTYVTWLSGAAGGPAFYRVSTSLFPVPGPDGQFDCLPNGGQTSKNALVIGAINDITADPYVNGNVMMSSFSSWGPTDDGRLGVDLVANGLSVFSSIATTNASYASFQGTSMAAPNTTGTLALLREHTINKRGAAPTAATLKGMAIHTAFDAGNAGPDYTYGWGVLDAAAAANFVTNTVAPTPKDFILENIYNGSVWSMTVASDGLGPMKATLVWQDAAGPAQDDGLSTAVLNLNTPELIDDLNVWIQDGFGTTYYPWNLDAANPSVLATRNALNHVENTEQVLINSPAAGLYTIFVGHTGASFSQNYSLLFSGASFVPEPTSCALAVIGFAFVFGRRRRWARS